MASMPCPCNKQIYNIFYIRIVYKNIMCSSYEIIIKPIRRLCNIMNPMVYIIVRTHHFCYIVCVNNNKQRYFFFFDTRVYDDQNNIPPYGDKNNNS